MSLSAYEIALISGGFGIVGTLLGALCTYYFATKLADTHAAHAARQAEVNALREGKARLRAAFSLTLGCISAASRHRDTDPDRPDVSDFLRKAFVGHAAAVEEFRSFVPTEHQPAYEKAWQEYCALEPTLDSGAEFMVTNQPEPLRVIEERIYAILLFAKT